MCRSFILDGQPEPGPGEDYLAQWIEVDPEFFRALSIDMMAGRPFTDVDDVTSTPVAIVNETFVRDLDEGALVGRVLQSVRDERLDRQIVGVAPDLAMRARYNDQSTIERSESRLEGTIKLDIGCRRGLVP